jgi:putative ABC transport system permease protein
MNDLRYAFRALAKSPLFSAIAIATFALGIGLNTAMFSLINAIYLRPLPFEDPESLVRVFRTTPDTREGDLSAADYAELRASESGFGAFAASFEESVALAEAGRPAMNAHGLRVSAGYLGVLGIQPEIGRPFRPEEEVAGNHRVVILSHALWQGRYGADPGVLGRTLRVEGEPNEIIGVLPQAADDGRLIRDIDTLRPLGLTAAERASRNGPWLRVIGRRSGMVSKTHGDALVASIGAGLARAHPKDDADASLASVSLRGATNNPSGRIVASLLLGLSGFVLLIACANLANFVIARTIERAQELSVRSALGASLFHLIRPLALEALTLAAAGGALALFVARWATDWLSAQSVANGGSLMAFPLDWRVLGFALASALATALLFGTAPSLLIARLNAKKTLRVGLRGATTGTGHRRLRSLLVIGQFAMATTLLAGAGFLASGASRLLRQHFGWNSTGVAMGAVDLPKARYPNPDAVLEFQRRLDGVLGTIPGVDSVALAYGFPYAAAFDPRPYWVEGRARPAKGQEPSASYDGISPDYFKVIGGRVVAGRAFADSDTAKSPRVVVINESMARALFPNETPIGRRLSRAEGEGPDWAEIVGIAADVRATGIYRFPPAFQVYHPIVQEPWQHLAFAVRTRPGALDAALASLAKAVATLDPDLPVSNLMTADAAVERSSFDLGMLKKMLGAFAALGLLLAALGLYGVIARTVAQRTPEIGIRMALGASMASVRRLVLASGLRLALAGVGLGLAGAYAVTRLLESMMPAIGASEGGAVAEAVGSLGAVAFLACYLPARSASKVDPATAIRTD